MLIEEAKTLRGHPALIATQVQCCFKIVNVENDFILPDGEGIKIIEVREQEPYFRSIVAYGSFGIACSTQVVSKFDEQLLRLRIKRFGF